MGNMIFYVKKSRYRLAAVFLVMLSQSILSSANGVESAADIVAKMRQAMDSLHDYTCTLNKRELVRNKIIEERAIILKVKCPGHFYLKWTEGKNKGIEAIFVQGRNKNKMVVHLNGLFRFLTVSLDPNGKRAMKHNRHPITQAGIGAIVERTEADLHCGLNDPDCRIAVSEPQSKNAWQVNATFPPGKGYYTHTATMIIDRQMGLPVRLTCYGWNNEFLEDYFFENVKTNVGLTEKDFDTKNPDYRF
jgi:outer membrane lipoprotein-sorting protein